MTVQVFSQRCRTGYAKQAKRWSRTHERETQAVTATAVARSLHVSDPAETAIGDADLRDLAAAIDDLINSRNGGRSRA